MTLYYTDFSEYAVGVQPADWTRTAGDSAFTVESDVGFTGGQKLVKATGSVLSVLSWDDTDDGNTEHEVVVRCRVNNGPSDDEIRVALRNDGVGNLLTARLAETDDQVQAFFGVSSIAQVAFAFADDVFVWIRCRSSGTGATRRVQVRAWLDSDPEPATWQIDELFAFDVTDGPAGVAGEWFHEFEVDTFGVATDGETAPIAAVVWQACDPALTGTTWADCG